MKNVSIMLLTVGVFLLFAATACYSATTIHTHPITVESSDPYLVELMAKNETLHREIEDNNKLLAISSLALMLIAFFIPPLAVALTPGHTKKEFWINMAWTFIGFWLLGFIHAVIIINRYTKK